MNNINFNEVNKIKICFDNGEYIILNNDCIKNFNLTVNKNTIKIFNIKVIDNGNIDFCFAPINSLISPIKRLQNKDIYKIDITYKNGNNIEFDVPCEIYDNETEEDWGYSSIRDYSCNQHSKLISYKEIELYIAENSREYTLQEALEELKYNDVILDSKGKEYTLYEDKDGNNFLLGGIINLKLLNEKFIKKVSDK